jgi:hypothetical protein
MTVTALPYLFSPANFAAAGSFLERFQSEPSEGRMRHPDVGGSPGALAAAATVLGSALRLSEEGGQCPAGWRLMACEPYTVNKPHALFRFEDGITPRIFGGEAAFENQLGQFVSVLWRRDEDLELRTGWAWDGVTAAHTSVLPTEGEGPPRTSYEMQFEERMAVSLRKFLNVSETGTEAVLVKIAELVLASGLVANPGPEAFTSSFEKGEPSLWTPMRLDHYAIRFKREPTVNILGFAVSTPDEKIVAEKIGLRVSSPPSENPLPLPPPLIALWDLAQSLAMGRMPGSTDRPS